MDALEMHLRRLRCGPSIFIFRLPTTFLEICDVEYSHNSLLRRDIRSLDFTVCYLLLFFAVMLMMLD